MLNGGAAVMVPDTCFTELSVWNTKDPSMATMGSITGALPDGTRIRWRDNGYTELHDIARLAAGVAKTYPAGTLFTPDSATHFTDCIQVIFTGQNDGNAAKQIETTVPAVQSAVGKIEGGRYVVISTHKNRSDEMEAAFLAAFGEHYLNLHAALASRGLAIAVANGWMTEKAAATTWDTKGTGLLSADNLHFNGNGYRVLAYLVKEKLQALGYLGGTPVPPPPVDPGDPTQTAALYTWIGPSVGDWADPANWRPSEAGAFAIPSNAAARVEFPAGDWTVRGGGAAFPVGNLTFAARANVTLADVTFIRSEPQSAFVGGESADLRLDAARIVLADKAAMGFGKYGSTTLANSTVVDGNMLIKLYYDPLLRVCGGRSIINGALAWKSDKNAKNRFDIQIDDADLVVRGLFEFGNASDVVGGIRPVLALTNGTLQADSWTAVTPFTVDLTVPSDGFATAPIAVLDQANLATNLTFRIDATACSVNGTYPLVEARTILLPDDGIDAFTLDCRTAPGCTARLVAETVERGNVPEAVGRIALEISGGSDPVAGGQPVLAVSGGGGAGGFATGTVAVSSSGVKFSVKVGAGGVAPTEEADGGDGVGSSLL